MSDRPIVIDRSGDFASEDRIDQLLGRVVRLRALVRDVEWVRDTGLRMKYCPLCENRRSSGHTPDCAIGVELSRETI